jgi:hypothetical protein
MTLTFDQKWIFICRSEWLTSSDSTFHFWNTDRHLWNLTEDPYFKLPHILVLLAVVENALPWRYTQMCTSTSLFHHTTLKTLVTFPEIFPVYLIQGFSQIICHLLIYNPLLVFSYSIIIACLYFVSSLVGLCPLLKPKKKMRGLMLRFFSIPTRNRTVSLLHSTREIKPGCVPWWKEIQVSNSTSSHISWRRCSIWSI